MAKTTVILDKRSKLKESKYNLSIQISNYYTTDWISLPYQLKEKDWDKTKREIRKSCEEFNAVVENNNIKNYKQLLDNIIIKISLKENIKNYTAKDLKTLFLQSYESRKIGLKNVGSKSFEPNNANIYSTFDSSSVDFLPLFTEYAKISKEENPNTSTCDTFLTTRQHLLDFTNNPNLIITNITLEFLNNLKEYFSNVKEHSVATMGINFTNIRTIYNYAIKVKKIISKKDYPFDGFSMPKEKSKKKVPLEVNEIGRLFKYNPKDKGEEMALDIFKLLFCFLGLNMKDLLYLQKSYIFNNRLYFDRQKTHKELSIKIIPEAWEIIKKYEGNNFLLNLLEDKINIASKNRKSRIYTDITKTTNKFLKRIALLPEIKIRKLSTAYARNSFATIASEVGIEVKHIQKCLGHVSNEVIDRYIYVRKEHIDNAQDEVLFYVNNYEAYHAFKQKEKNERRQKILNALDSENL